MAWWSEAAAGRPGPRLAAARLAAVTLIAAVIAALLASVAVPTATATAAASAPPAATEVIPSANGLSPTPYMGWNTYFGVGTHYNEAAVESVADALVARGLRDAGYRYLWLDGGWWSGTRDAAGNITVDPKQWPDGMAAVAAYIHARGLLAGIYTDAGPGSCGNPHARGSYGHYQQDANQFAAWGFDALKVDFCGGNRHHLIPAQAYAAFGAALRHNASGRPILFNICNPFRPNQLGPRNPTYQRSAYYSASFGPFIANSWRTNSDIGVPGRIRFPGVLRNLDADAAHPEAAGPGHWNDPDYLGPELGLTPTEARTQFTMWAVVAAPLILGTDPRSMSASTLAMVTNREVIAIDQDPLGRQGQPVSRSAQAEVWVRPLADGERAVALLNRGSRPLTLATTLSAIGFPGASTYVVDDVWGNRTVTHRTADTHGRISASVLAHGMALYRVRAQ